MTGQQDMPPIRVLYVDDDAALARLVQKSLGRGRFEVEHLSDTDDAMARIARPGVDVIALDHYLPSGTGLDFLARLSGEAGVPPVVYVTGSSELNLGVAAMKAGASDFVPKTVGEDFVTLLETALEQVVAKAALVAQKEAAEAEVRLARDRAELLLAEVNHRVANSLAMVASLVSLQANQVTDKVAKDALSETRARILAIASVHKRLYGVGSLGHVDLGEYLGGLLQNLQQSMQAQGHGGVLTADLVPMSLSTDSTINLGIVVTELVTNAFKYAYPGQSGEIRVRLTDAGVGRAQLTVEDDGVGRVGTVKGTGLGTQIVNAMATTLAAEFTYTDRKPGTAATLTFNVCREA